MPHFKFWSQCAIPTCRNETPRSALYWGTESHWNSYLLHGDLWLGGHVLLGVAHTSGIFVLGHGTHWGGSGWSTSRALAEGLGGWGEGGEKGTSSKLHQVINRQWQMISFWKLRYLRIRWEAIMRGTWVLAAAVGRMVLKAWGLGADGRIALGMFWKSEGRGNKITYPQ